MKSFIKDAINVMNPVREENTEVNGKKVEDKLAEFKQRRGLDVRKENIETQTTEMSNSKIVTAETALCRLVEPQDENDAFVIADLIESGKIVLVKLEKLDSDTANKILQFVMGVCYASKLALKKIDGKMIMVDPTKNN